MVDEPHDLRPYVYATLLRPSPLSRFQERAPRQTTIGAVTYLRTGHPAPDGNQVMVLGAAWPEDVFAPATEFFGSRDAYSVIVDVEAAPEVDTALRAQYWQLDEEEPALVLTPLPARVPGHPPELTIRRVADEATLDDFYRLSRTGRRHLPSLAAATAPGIAVFVGFVGGEAVATSRLTCLGDVADVMGVTTVPDRRRRGYGMAMTWAAVAAAAAQGCVAAALTATALGYPVYVRMGFVPVCTFRTYLPPAPQPNGLSSWAPGSA